MSSLPGFEIFRISVRCKDENITTSLGGCEIVSLQVVTDFEI